MIRRLFFELRSACGSGKFVVATRSNIQLFWARALRGGSAFDLSAVLWLVLPRSPLLGLVVPCRALPCLASPCLASLRLPCLALPCLALPCVALPCNVLPCPPPLPSFVLPPRSSPSAALSLCLPSPCLVLPRPACLALPCIALLCLASQLPSLSCVALLHLAFLPESPCLTLQCLALSCLASPACCKQIAKCARARLGPST